MDVSKFRRAQQERIERGEQLLADIKDRLSELKELYAKLDNEWRYPDHVYRYYHQSFKAYYAQGSTVEIIETLEHLAPDLPLNPWFMNIIKRGTGIKFERAHNRNWEEVVEPILTAFLHARSMLELIIRVGDILEEAPTTLPVDWAAVLYLYQIR